MTENEINSDAKPMRGKGLRLLLFALLLCLAPPLALAWWARSHPTMTEAAAAALPDDVPEFFRKGAATIASYSGDPDLWTDPSVPVLRDAERGNHFIDLEVFAGKELPPTRLEYSRLCWSLKTDADRVGTLPYALQEAHERLLLAFLEHRKRPDDQATRAKALYLAGILAHYAEDASQPLHATIHFDGRAKTARGSPRSGIHVKVDALPEKMKLTAEEIARDLKKVEAPKEGEAPFVTIMAAIKESFGGVDRVYELEPKLPASDAEPPKDPDPAVRAFTLERCRAGARLTAALWYSAWVRSGKMELPEWHRWAKPGVDAAQ